MVHQEVLNAAIRLRDSDRAETDSLIKFTVSQEVSLGPAKLFQFPEIAYSLASLGAVGGCPTRKAADCTGMNFAMAGRFLM